MSRTQTRFGNTLLLAAMADQASDGGSIQSSEYAIGYMSLTALLASVTVDSSVKAEFVSSSTTSTVRPARKGN